MLHHDPVVVVMAPAVVPTTIVMPLVMMPALDDNLFSVGNRRSRDRDRADGSNNVSKFLHGVLLLRSAH